MASDKLNFDWGDEVTVIQSAPRFFNPGFKGSICGIRTIDSKETSFQFGQPIGTELYLVEFENGDSLEIPKGFLSKLSTNENLGKQSGYTKKILGQELREKLDQNWSPHQIGKWAFKIYFNNIGDFDDKEMREIIQNLFMMEEGVEFEYTQPELKLIAERLIKEYENPLRYIEELKTIQDKEKSEKIRSINSEFNIRSVNKKQQCPVCGYNLGFEPWVGQCSSDKICPCCGIQYGYDDCAGGDLKMRKQVYLDWRKKWIKEGMPWKSVSFEQPVNWNPIKQISNLQKNISDRISSSHLYSKKEIGEGLKMQLKKGYNIERISNWASDLYFDSKGEFSKNINDVLQDIFLMEAGPEFVHSEQELTNLADSLIKEDEEEYKP